MVRKIEQTVKVFGPMLVVFFLLVVETIPAIAQTTSKENSSEVQAAAITGQGGGEPAETKPPSQGPYSGDFWTRSTLTGDWGGFRNEMAAVSPVEASLANSNLRVVVQKNKQGWYMPEVGHEEASGATEPPDSSLLSVALQPSTPWPLPEPNRSTSDPVYQPQLAAYQYISKNVGATNSDIRSYYWKGDISPSTWISYCNSLQYPTPAPSPYFSQVDFTDMQKQLCGTSGEFNYVNNVNGFKGDMDYVLTQMQVSSGTTLYSVYNAVKTTVSAPDDHPVLYNAAEFVSRLLMIRMNISTDPIAKVTMGIVNAGLVFGLKLSKTASGADYTAVNVAPLYLVNEMNNLWTSCQKGKDILLDMIKSDWGKLQYVGNKFMTPQDQGGWQYGDTDRNDWVTHITNSLESYYFQCLLPSVWKIDYKLNQTDSKYQPSPKTFEYDGPSGGLHPCRPYCGAPSTADWVDAFSNNTSDWYVLEDKINERNSDACG